MIGFDKLPDRLIESAREFQFAGVVALTRTALDCRDAVRDSLAQEFTLRNNFTQRGIRITPATKKTPISKVFSVDQYIADHEEGTTRQPPGENFIIPAHIRDVFKIPNRRKIPKSKSRSRIVGRKIGKSKPFVGKTTKGKPGIFYTDRDNRTRLLYAIHKNPVQIKSKEWFFPVVDKTYTDRFPKQYKRALDEGFNKLKKS